MRSTSLESLAFWSKLPAETQDLLRRLSGAAEDRECPTSAELLKTASGTLSADVISGYNALIESDVGLRVAVVQYMKDLTNVETALRKAEKKPLTAESECESAAVDKSEERIKELRKRTEQTRIGYRLFVTRLCELRASRSDYLAGNVDACVQCEDWHSVLTLSLNGLIQLFNCFLFLPQTADVTFVQQINEIRSSLGMLAITPSKKSIAAIEAEILDEMKSIEDGDSDTELELNIDDEILLREVNAFSDLFCGVCQGLFSLDKWSLLHDFASLWREGDMDARAKPCSDACWWLCQVYSHDFHQLKDATDKRQKHKKKSAESERKSAKLTQPLLRMDPKPNLDELSVDQMEVAKKWYAQHIVALMSDAISFTLKEPLPWYFVRRSYFHWEMGRKQPAVDDLTFVIEKIDGNYKSAFNDRAFYLNEMGRFAESLMDCDSGLAIDSSKPNLFRHRGFAHFHLGHYNAAIRDTNHAIALNPEYKEALDNLKLMAHFYHNALANALEYCQQTEVIIFDVPLALLELVSHFVVGDAFQRRII